MKWPADSIELRSVESLIPYDNNPRLHSPDHIAQIARSIGEFGFTMPVLVDEAGAIIAGHGRVLAAKAMGLGKVPTVSAVGWTEVQRRAYRIADNQLTLSGGWNDELLRSEIIQLQRADYDLALTGFDEVGLADLMDRMPQGATDPDEAPEAPRAPASRPGDCWLLGRHRLVCGNSAKPETLCAALNALTPNLMIADPPYGISIVPKSGKIGGDKGFNKNIKVVKSRVYSEIMGDDENFDPRPLLGAAKQEIIFGANFFSALLPSGQWIVWDKERGEDTTFSDAELAWTNGNGKAIKIYRCKWNGMIREGESGPRYHPAQKPAKLYCELIDDYSQTKNLVYDPFVGSGTTVIAAEMTGRACHAIELNPCYVDVSVQRWQNFTEQKATLDGDGRTFDEVAMWRKPFDKPELLGEDS